MADSNLLTVELASGEPLDVREFTVEEDMSRLFEIEIVATSTSTDLDFEAAIGQTARFTIKTSSESRSWSGICALAARSAAVHGHAQSAGRSAVDHRAAHPPRGAARALHAVRRRLAQGAQLPARGLRAEGQLRRGQARALPPQLRQLPVEGRRRRR